MNRFRYLVILFCSLIQIGCRVNIDSLDIPNLQLLKKDINKDVVIYAPGGWNSYLIGQPISIMVENKGEDIIVFTNDYGINVYTNKNGNWIELEVVPTQYLEGDIYLIPAENDPIYFGSTMFEPIIVDQSQPIKIRITVKGNRYIDNYVTDQLVAAYTDVWIFPK